MKSRMQSFGPTIKKVRKFTKKYRMSPKAKSFLYTLYQRRLPGFIDIRWYVLSLIKTCLYELFSRWSELIAMRAFREMAKQPGDLAGQVIKEMKWDIQNLTSEENLDLIKYVDLMTPIEFLFLELNAETRCTIHRVYPTLKVCQLNL